MRPRIDPDVLAIYEAHGLKPGARPPREVSPGYIDLTPTYRGVLPVLLAALEHATPEGRTAAVAELYRIADVADLYNAIGGRAADNAV